MKVSIILNGISRKKKKFYREIYPTLQKNFEVDIHETRYAAHARELAFQLTESNISILLAAGGDGTLHDVINGVLKSNKVSPTIGLIPIGSGNDFARSVSLNLDGTRLVNLINSKMVRPTDVGRIHCHNPDGSSVTEYFTNVCSLGMGPEVVRRLQKNKNLGPLVSYMSSIISTFLTLKPSLVHCKTPNWEWTGLMRVVAIANGVSFGNATYIAPDAVVDDGYFNSFIAGNYSLLKFLSFLNMLKGKKKVNDKGIEYNLLTTAQLTSPEIIPIEADGELVGVLPAHIEILAGKINFFR